MGPIDVRRGHICVSSGIQDCGRGGWIRDGKGLSQGADAGLNEEVPEIPAPSIS